jgi:hypothetical protein
VALSSTNPTPRSSAIEAWRNDTATTVVGAHQRKRREQGEIESVLENQRGFDTAIGQKEAAVQLRQSRVLVVHDTALI